MLTHNDAAKNAATNAVTGQIGANGFLKFRTAGTIGAPGAVAAALPLSADAFADAVAGVAQANPITPDTDADGNAAEIATATLETAGGVIVIHCAVAAAGADINLTNGLVIAPGDTVSVSALSYQALGA